MVKVVGNLVRGVVRGLVHVQRCNVIASIDRCLFGHVALFRNVKADGHVARVGDVPIDALSAVVSRVERN